MVSRAGSRTRFTHQKEKRITPVDLQFIEVEDTRKFMKDLGIRSIPVNELPLAIPLWQSPMPWRLLDPLTMREEQPS